MGKTFRKDKKAGKIVEGIIKKSSEVSHRCRCEHCTGVGKNYLCEKIMDKSLKKYLKNLDG